MIEHRGTVIASGGSEMFPATLQRRREEQTDDFLERVVTEHHRCLTRQARVLEGQAKNLAHLDRKVESVTPAKLIQDFETLETAVDALRERVTSLRTVLITVAVLLGGGYSAGKAIETTRPPVPTVVQVTPETVRQLHEMLSK